MSETARWTGELPWLRNTAETYNDFMSVVANDRGGLKTGFKRLDAALNGLQTGFHIVAGEANCGKTFLISQMAWQVATYNAKTHVIDITLDDTKTEKLFRLVAHLTGISINTIKRANSQPQVFQAVRQAVDHLRSAVMSYEILDNAEAGTLQNLCELIYARRSDLLSIDPEYRLAVFIDSFHDILSTEKHPSDTSKYDYLAQTLSDLANRQDIPIVCTAELRKLNGMRRPSLDDIRESVKIRYEAKSVLLVYNDISSRGDQADVFWYRHEDLAKYPILELHVAKNKFASFKGRICLEFIPEVAYLHEPDDAAHKKYLDIVNTKR